jgi:hypothetical protein
VALSLPGRMPIARGCPGVPVARARSTLTTSAVTGGNACSPRAFT